MEKGRVEVHTTPGTIIKVSTTVEDLYWYDERGGRKSRRRIVDSGVGKDAFGCKPCGIIAIDTASPATPATRGKRRLRRNKPNA